MLGWSHGGMETYLALTKTKRIRSAVVGSGLTDLISSATVRNGQVLTGTDVKSQVLSSFNRKKS